MIAALALAAVVQNASPDYSCFDKGTCSVLEMELAKTALVYYTNWKQTQIDLDAARAEIEQLKLVPIPLDCAEPAGPPLWPFIAVGTSAVVVGLIAGFFAGAQ